jgi:adenylate cyclase
MGADEEGTHERLKAHLGQLVGPKIGEHRGRTVKNTGDGFLAEFASVVDAVRCAVELQRGMADRNADLPEDKRITFRVGINLGDVIVEEHDIFGDGVNVAARLEALAEPGEICVSRMVRDNVRDKLDYSFEDLGEQQVKNIARPVRVYRVRDRDALIEKPSPTSSQPLPLPDKPSIAVLPFANMSGDPEQEYFADGMVEEIITALSRYPSLFVIARNSSFTYKGRAVDVKSVARELGVRYVLEGSLRKSGSRIRVTAQLVEAETGKHIWAERYDRDLADIFAVQDAITEAVTIASAPVIAQAERQRAIRRPPENLDAWAAYQRGLWHLSKFSAADNGLARKFFQQAIALDPNFARGYCGLSDTEWQALTLQMPGFVDPESLAEAEERHEQFARHAVALDDADPEARIALAGIRFRRGDCQGVLAETERVLAIAPNLAAAHGHRGAALIYSGKPKEGLASLETFFRLDPHSPSRAARLHHVQIGHYFCRDYEASIEAAKRVIWAYPEFPNTYRWLAAALGQLGRIEEAKQALEKAIAIAPSQFETRVRRRVPWHRSEDHAHMLEGLRKAGMPEE